MIQNPRRRAEHRGIFLACSLNAAVLAGSRIFDAEWSPVAFMLLAPLQLVWLAPIASFLALWRPRSGYAKGVVIGAAISAIVSAGYCCQETKKPAPAPAAPASRPASRPVVTTMADPAAPATLARAR